MNEKIKATAKRKRSETEPRASVGSRTPERAALPDLVGRIMSESSFTKGITLFLCESDILRRLLHDKSKKQFAHKADVCSDLAKVGAALDNLVTIPLFGEPSPLLIELPAKLGKSAWAECIEELTRLLPENGAASGRHPPVWILGSTALRRTVTIPAWMTCYLTYSPRRAEALNIVKQLYSRHISPERETARQDIADALAIYDIDFIQADDHFSRMSNTGLKFHDVFTDVPALDVFRLVEALPVENLPQILLRLDQCHRNGEDAGRIHSATSSFLRQFLRFSVLLERGLTEDRVFEELGLPYPARAKFTYARKRFKLPSVQAYLERAPTLELELRQSSRGHDILAVEYAELFS